MKKLKDRIKKEALEWYEMEKNGEKHSIEDLIDLVMTRTTEALVDEVKTILKKDFRDGTLKHNHIVSSEYYLELKLKEVKHNFFKD